MKLEKNECYLCGSYNIQPAFIKLGYNIFLCNSCRLYHLDFKEKYEQFIKNYYKQGYFTGDKNLRAYADYEGDRLVELRNMRRYINLIKEYKQKGNLLDVGCALGFLLEEAKNNGFEPYGLDVSEYACQKAKEKFGERVKLGNLSQLMFPKKKFEVVTMFDLVEHLKTPIEDLIRIRRLLRDNGLLVIQTGDTQSLWAKILKKKWHFFAPPQHLFFYSNENIKLLLKKAGFKVIKMEKIGKWISLRYLFHMMRYVGGDGLGDFLYEIVHNNKVGKIPIFLKFNDNMIVFAKKI